ncbi:MAG: energy transducer TonB [Chitinophagales bacterium]
MQNFATLLFLFFTLTVCTGFKPPKNNGTPNPKNDILYTIYGGDVDKMLEGERKKDSMARPYLYQTITEEKKEPASTVDDESNIKEKAEIMPTYVAGDKALQEYVKQNAALVGDSLVGVKATVTVKFFINTLGDARYTKILKTDNPSRSFDLEVMRIIDGMEKWNPAKQNGVEVNCYQTMTIKFGE